MAKSQQTFNKSEKEKKRLKKREDKRKKMEARKLEREEGGSDGIQFAYVDFNGNLTDTPPDNSKGFGFIIDSEDQEKYFCHVSGLIDEIAENDAVSFELEKGMKGMNAVKVTRI